MSRKLYLIDLSGQGDRELALVEKVAHDWILSPPPKFDRNNSGKDKIPDEVLLQLKKEHESDSFLSRCEFESPTVSRGSWENDRALCAVTACYVTIDGEEAQFDTVKEMNKFCRKHGIEIEEEYSGHIY